MAKRGSRRQKYLAAITPYIAKIKSANKKAKLTRRILNVQEDWLLWEAAERKQLSQCEDQGMITQQVPIPHDINCLPFLCTYVLKDDGIQKARVPCNGSPRMQGMVTLGETYAASLDQMASKIYWAISAEKEIL